MGGEAIGGEGKRSLRALCSNTLLYHASEVKVPRQDEDWNTYPLLAITFHNHAEPSIQVLPSHK